MRAALLPLLVAGCATSAQVHPSGVNTFVRHYNNVHVIDGARGFVMIDAGLEADGPSLEADLRATGHDPAHLEAIVLTHGHADHAGGARYFQQTYGTKIVVGQGDVDLLAKGRNDRLCPTNATARRRLHEDQATTFAPVTPEVIVTDALPLRTVSSASGTIISVPGHTEGSLVVVVDRGAFVGDLFRGSIFGKNAERHFYMCDLPGNDADIRALLAGPAKDVDIFFPGHFGPIERSSVERRFGPRLRM